MMSIQLLASDGLQTLEAAEFQDHALPTMAGIDDPHIETAFAEMLPVLKRIFAVKCSSREVDDLLAETRRKVLMRYKQRAASFHTRAHPWIERVARNVAMNHNRKGARRGGLRDSIAQANVSPRHGRVPTSIFPYRTLRGGDCVVAEDHHTPESRAIKHEQRELLWMCIRELGVKEPGLRFAVALHFAGVDGTTLARCLEIPRTTCYTRLERAELLLKELMRSLLNNLDAGHAAHAHMPWTARKQRAAQTAWGWIWEQDEAGSQTAMLALFGQIDRPALERFEFRLDIDWHQLEQHEAQLSAAGWN